MSEPTIERIVLRAEEVARLLDLSVSQVYRLAAAGEIPAVYFGRSVRFPRRAVEERLLAVGRAG